MIGQDTDRARADELVAELEQLVRIAAKRPALELRRGEPGCAWSFHWARNVVTVDPDHVRLCAPDLCRGLVLHEATHAAVTRYHGLLSRSLLERYGAMMNVVEDVRIEIWMRAKFPGAAPWIRAYNDALFGQSRLQPPPRSRQAQFLCGLLETWWFGGLSPNALPEVTDAIEAVRRPLAEATACQPPLDDDENATLAAQRCMWDVVKTRIIPVYDRLAAADRREGLGDVAERELAEMLEASGAGSGSTDAQAVRRMPEGGGRRFAQAASRGSGGVDPKAAISAALATDGRDAYLAAWMRVAPLAEALGDELLRELVPNQRLRWTSGHPSGTRLDIRRAMQFSADPRQYRSLWLRPVVPTRQDPAFVLLIDRSGSMSQENRIEAAFDALVLLTEVCKRIGVHVAAASFASGYREELPWDEALDDSARRRLGLILRSCDGDTRMGLALAGIRAMLAPHHGDPKIVFVLSDGEPHDPDSVVKQVQGMRRDGVNAIGLGLGTGTEKLANFFPHAITGILPNALVGKVGELVRESMLGRPAARA